MSSYHDSQLLEHLNTQVVDKFTVISTLDIYIENINKNFPFTGDGVDFKSLKREKYYKSTQDNISVDVVHFVNELIQDNVCTKNERVVYVGDSLSENGYEVYFGML